MVMSNSVSEGYAGSGNRKNSSKGVNIHQDKVRMMFDLIMHYITPEDYEAAKKYVKDPETYDFKKILNW